MTAFLDQVTPWKTREPAMMRPDSELASRIRQEKTERQAMMVLANHERAEVRDCTCDGATTDAPADMHRREAADAQS